MVKFIKKNPSPLEYLKLRKAVGWDEMPENVVKTSLERNIFAVCAFVEDEIVGMARIVGDGGLCFYIQDVVVEPAYQKQGIGTALMQHIMGFLKENASHNSSVGLMSVRGRENFYARFGFHSRPNESMGAGMTQFWGRDNKYSECNS